MSTLKVNNIQNASGTNAISIDGSGNVTLAQNLAATTMSGDLTLGANGIYLGGTGAANYLDDYEEGTCTLSVSGSTSDPTVSYTSRACIYTKIGDRVFISFNLQGSISVLGSGEIRISGFPFTTGNRYQGATTLGYWYTTGALTTTDFRSSSYLNPNSTYGRIGEAVPIDYWNWSSVSTGIFHWIGTIEYSVN